MKLEIICLLIALLNHLAVCYYELVILHANNIAGRFDETYGKNYLPCVVYKQCVGGLPRMATKIREIRNSHENVVFLFTGGILYGSLWFKLWTWNISATMLNMLEPDAVGLNELDMLDIHGYHINYIQAVKNPVVRSKYRDLYKDVVNIKLKESILIDKGKFKIGIVGSVSESIDPSDDFDLSKNVNYVKKIVDSLKEQGANIIIVMCHKDLAFAKEFATENVDINVIVLGQEILLWSGIQPVAEKTSGPYPVTVKNPFSKKIVSIVAAYGFSKYLGELDLQFDENFNMTSSHGSPVLLTHDLPKARDVEEVLNIYRPAVTKFKEKVLGTTAIAINDKACSQRECLIGDVVTDSYRLYYLAKKGCNRFMPITFETVDQIKSGIKFNPKAITWSDISSCLPNSQLIKYDEVNGDFVETLFNVAVTGSVTAASGFKWFFQVSGVQVIYNLQMSQGNRVFNIKVQRCDGGFETLQKNQTYIILYNKAILLNPYVCSLEFKPNPDAHLNVTNDEVLAWYFKTHSPISASIENRINNVGRKSDANIVDFCAWIFTLTSLLVCL